MVGRKCEPRHRALHLTLFVFSRKSRTSTMDEVLLNPLQFTIYSLIHFTIGRYTDYNVLFASWTKLRISHVHYSWLYYIRSLWSSQQKETDWFRPNCTILYAVAQAQVRFQFCPCGICGAGSNTVTDFSLIAEFFLGHYHWSIIILSSTATFS